MFAKSFCVFKSACYGNVYFRTVYVVSSFFNTVRTSYGGKFHVIERFTRKRFYRGTESGFHNAARCAEYYACARVFAERRIVIGIGKFGKQYALCLNHFCEFSCGENRVYIFATRGSLIVTVLFELFGNARHNRYDVQFRRIYAEFFGIIGLYGCAEHLLRRFTGGDIGDKFGIVIFHKSYPTG